MRRFSFILVLALMLSACRSSVGEAPDLLRTVPSRSIEVMHFNNAGKALPLLLDSTHVFRKLDLGKLEGTEMVLSYDYSSTLVPLLSLDAGRYRMDSSETVKSILRQAGELKLQAAYVVDSVRRNTALLITPSSASLSEAMIHIKAGTSILDAGDFVEAFGKTRASEGFIMLRHSAGGYLVPRTFLAAGELHRGVLSRFIREACKWTVINFDSYDRDGLDMEFSPLGPAQYYMTIFQELKGGDSRLGEILPVSADWVVDLPLRDWEAFYEARCRWMDATSRLKRHEWKGEDLAKANGLSPQDWCRRIRPKEVALVRWDGHIVTLVRQTKAPAAKELEPSACPGYAALMFGSLFSESENSVCSTVGKWLVTGSAEDVTAFAAAEKADRSLGKKIKFAIINPDFRLVGSEKGTVLNLTKE